MSNNEYPGGKILESEDFKNLPKDLQNKIAFMLGNPTARIVKLSDEQRGSNSQFFYGAIGSIDMISPVLADMVALKTEPKDLTEFFIEYAAYAEEIKKLTLLLREVDKKGKNLLASHIKKPSAIRNKRLRKLIQEAKKKTENPTEPSKEVTQVEAADVAAEIKEEIKEEIK